MPMVAQCKGKDLTDVATSKLINDGWWVSTKYDGHYVQIHILEDTVKFYTSGGKEFRIPELAEKLMHLNPCILEAEYIGQSKGLLGNRTQVGKLTTYRTNFAKGLPTKFDHRERFKLFDMINYNLSFEERIGILQASKFPEELELVKYIDNCSLDTVKAMGAIQSKLGFEGVYAKHRSHIYEPGKRVNTAIKVKRRLTADLRCIDIVPGEGKYTGLIGSLVLEDSQGITVSVGSGLTDLDRERAPSYFMGKIVEIAYEQILDTYIQPTYLWVREDKVTSD